MQIIISHELLINRNKLINMNRKPSENLVNKKTQRKLLTHTNRSLYPKLGHCVTTTHFSSPRNLTLYIHIIQNIDMSNLILYRKPFCDFFAYFIPTVPGPIHPGNLCMFQRAYLHDFFVNFQSERLSPMATDTLSHFPFGLILFSINLPKTLTLIDKLPKRNFIDSYLHLYICTGMFEHHFTSTVIVKYAYVHSFNF